jgi:hypothetical protein
MPGPIRVPAEDPSTSSRILDGNAPNGEPIVSVVFGMTFAVGRDGKCTAKGYTLVDQAEWEKAKTIGRYTRPSLLIRDADIWPWKNFTDVVVQGSARSDKPCTHLEVELSVVGSKAKLSRTLSVTGNRWVDRGASGLVLSQPEPFTEMPLKYDRAYGGTDELAETRQAEEEVLNYLAQQVDREESEELSAFSYPRNPAGKGYLIDIDGAKGLPWPNLEFPEDRLRIESLARPVDQWGDRPYPACFDWFHHAWFPRSAHLTDLPLIHDDKVPMAERRLGLFEEGWESKQLAERTIHPFANGAHPYLCRERLVGDEKVTVTHTAPDGRDFVAQLPGLAPRVGLRLLGEGKLVLPASVDLLFVEPELGQLTLVWRATHLTKREHLPIDWIERSPYEIEW